MNVQNVPVIVATAESAKEPAEAVVGLDMVVGVVEPGVADFGGSGFMAGRVVRDVLARPREGDGAAPAGAQDENVHEKCRVPS